MCMTNFYAYIFFYSDIRFKSHRKRTLDNLGKKESKKNQIKYCLYPRTHT